MSITDTFTCPKYPSLTGFTYKHCITRQNRKWCEKPVRHTYTECALQCKRGKEIKKLFKKEASKIKSRRIICSPTEKN